jgi:hypothetical protein
MRRTAYAPDGNGVGPAVCRVLGCVEKTTAVITGPHGSNELWTVSGAKSENLIKNALLYVIRQMCL